MVQKGWFEVNKAGLAKLLEARGKEYAIFELIQNAWDTEAETVEVTLKKYPGRPMAELIVRDDDPDGFKDLRHAYTLFAESEKKVNPEQRGRFDLGEKLVLALCRKAEIRSTKGGVVFNSDGTRDQIPDRTGYGSVFMADIRMTREEYARVEEKVFTLIPPVGVLTTFNKDPIQHRTVLTEFKVTLPTVVADEEGNLVRRERSTVVAVYEPWAGEEATVYEMGLPVVCTGLERYHVDVGQKVPVTLDRENISPAYLRKLRAAVLSNTHGLLSKDDAKETWVTDAIGHPDVEPEAVKVALTKRFGEKRAIADPNDLEANSVLASEGYQIIQGGTFGKEQWKKIRESGAALPSGKIRPTPRGYAGDGDPADFMDWNDYTETMRDLDAFVGRMGHALLGVTVEMKVMTSPGQTWGGVFIRGDRAHPAELHLNWRRLGKRWFQGWKDNLADVLDLIIHEFGHQEEADHLSSRYHGALTALAGRAVRLALDDPDQFPRRSG